MTTEIALVVAMGMICLTAIIITVLVMWFC